MSKAMQVLVLSGLVGMFGASIAMTEPPPMGEGLQRMVVRTEISSWSGLALPGVVVGAPLSANWVFDSDQTGSSIEVTDSQGTTAGARLSGWYEPAPEPATYALMLAGLLAVAARQGCRRLPMPRRTAVLSL